MFERLKRLENSEWSVRWEPIRWEPFVGVSLALLTWELSFTGQILNDCLYLVQISLQDKLSLFPAKWRDSLGVLMVEVHFQSLNNFPLLYLPVDDGSIQQWILKSKVENNHLKLFSCHACQIHPRQDLRGKLSLICIEMSQFRQFGHHVRISFWLLSL